MKIRNLLITGAILSLAACKKEEIKPTYLEDETPAPVANTTEAAKSSAAGLLLPQSTGPAPMAVAGQTTAPGTNPPHGQPGHRCEIPVGAPLNSAPGAGNTQQIVVDPSSSGNTLQIDPNAAKPSQNTPTAAGMNPPHGEPGHRCDIAVGAPLNSPAKAAPATPPATAATTATPDPNAYNVQNKPAVASTAAGMNPPHGEPGHRCDIAVGAPLK
ncbi:hypothetical protein [Chryseobacterium sp. MFBS3-17]|uniref:hypothetical protein n=1 Tax=Chryseobacterium sp. MFBS3-17 TaxID=2886689 RepID=UPI001D0E6559|nr:hypothetical protein [Chryseobacterium sp. MFBS3-17]MCC2590538.1 hypothetical protein [Chryseobacterium sp. MFBS3-17]